MTTQRERQTQAAARAHLSAASKLQGQAIALKVTRWANRLGWGRPTNVRQQGDSYTLAYKAGYIVASITSGSIAIHPAE